MAALLSSVTVSPLTTPTSVPQSLTTASVSPSYTLSSEANPLTVRPKAVIADVSLGCAVSV